MELRNKMRKVVSSFSVISLTDDVEWLAKEYIHHFAVPENYPEDAYHIAIAVLNNLDIILSWNFKHKNYYRRYKMTRITEKEVKKIRKMVENEFPDDPALQQVHIARKIISREAELEGLSFLEYIKSQRRPVYGS
jgi:hypothetical protein